MKTLKKLLENYLHSIILCENIRNVIKSKDENEKIDILAKCLSDERKKMAHIKEEITFISELNIEDPEDKLDLSNMLQNSPSESFIMESK